MARKAKLTPVFYFALVLELLGLAAIGGGIGVEVVMKAHFGFVFISVGSLAMGLGGIIWGKVARRM
ncbi:hypothetical protein ES703_67361 [subsurface metagenome]